MNFNKVKKSDIIINIISFNNIIVPFIFPEEFINFNNIFSNKEAGRLPLYKDGDYIINIKSNPLYGLFYNLSNLELIELKRYLDNVLTRS